MKKSLKLDGIKGVGPQGKCHPPKLPSHEKEEKESLDLSMVAFSL